MSVPLLPGGARGLLLGVLLLGPSAALAQAAPIESGTSVSLKVGQQKTLNVGMAMGLDCDDPTIVRAELRAKSSSENQLVLTGLKPGKSACRAGTANPTRSVLVNITVTPKSGHNNH